TLDCPWREGGGMSRRQHHRRRERDRSPASFELVSHIKIRKSICRAPSHGVVGADDDAPPRPRACVRFYTRVNEERKSEMSSSLSAAVIAPSLNLLSPPLSSQGSAGWLTTP
ncbi:unnamed protein product, partial [Ectocarpus sp. 13 AM-2016]